MIPDSNDCTKMAADIDAVIALLDGRAAAEDSRIKINVVEGTDAGDGVISGRCDVGSPWAKGTAFDVLE